MKSDTLRNVKVMNYAVYDVENPPEEFGKSQLFGGESCWDSPV